MSNKKRKMEVKNKTAFAVGLNDMLANLNTKIEVLSEEVHLAWMKEKTKQGFHAPLTCKMRPVGSGEPFEKYCEKCHTDLYSYFALPENIKEYDRVTVRAVLKAIAKVG